MLSLYLILGVNIQMGTVFITGANRGLGLEFVKEFSEKDYEVIATCREPNSSSDLTNLAKSNIKIQLHQLDVRNTKNIQDLANNLDNKPIDILINNAGIYRSASFSSVNKDSWVESFITNTIGPYEVIENFLPNVLKGTKGFKKPFLSNFRALRGLHIL